VHTDHQAVVAGWRNKPAVADGYLREDGTMKVGIWFREGSDRWGFRFETNIGRDRRIARWIGMAIKEGRARAILRGGTPLVANEWSDDRGRFGYTLWTAEEIEEKRRRFNEEWERRFAPLRRGRAR
jgi:hypothetical protein